MTTTSWYRRSLWQFKGNREYTRSGYEAAKSRFGENDLDIDCSDRHFMITGANSGLGLETAVEIARRGGVLHLVCRNAESMKEARSHIITTTGNDRIYQHQVDLSKCKEVARWAKEFAVSHDRLDVLINNASHLTHERIVDEDGNESHFAVNVLATHIITITLVPLLQRTENARVIIVSSAGMFKVRLDPEDLNFEKMNPFDGRLAYSQTKRQQVIMNFCYAQRYEGIRFYCMHPGWADTPGVRKSLPDMYEAMKNSLRTPLQGADTIIWLAISEAALKHPTGLFFQDRTPTATHLPLAWTRHSATEEQQFMSRLDDLFIKYSPGSLDTISSPTEHSTEETSTNNVSGIGQENVNLPESNISEGRFDTYDEIHLSERCDDAEVTLAQHNEYSQGNANAQRDLEDDATYVPECETQSHPYINNENSLSNSISVTEDEASLQAPSTHDVLQSEKPDSICDREAGACEESNSQSLTYPSPKENCEPSQERSGLGISCDLNSETESAIDEKSERNLCNIVVRESSEDGKI